MSGGVRREDFWEDEGTIARRSAGPKRRRKHRLALTFYGALLAYYGGEVRADSMPLGAKVPELRDALIPPLGEGRDPPEVPPSVPTCEQLHTPGETADREADTADRENEEPTTGRVDLTPHERHAVEVALQVGVEEIEEAVDLVRSADRAPQVLYALLERGEEEGRRRSHALELLRAGDASGAARLAKCGQESVQLECPDEPGAGGCGHDQNYLPITCDHPLCPDCSKRRVGHAIEKYTAAVQGWENPVFGTFTIENVEDPAEGKGRVQRAMRKLRRRGIPTSGETGGTDGRPVKRWRWDGVEEAGPDTELWKRELLGRGKRDLARRLESRYVQYEYEDITGTHVGRRIPFDEVVRAGIVGYDVKQVAPDEFNVHAHTLMDCPYIPQAALAAVWEDITGAPVVDVRAVYGRDGETIESAVAETVAYACKPPEFEDPTDAAEFAVETKGQRMVQPFGDLHGNVPDLGDSLLCERCENTPNWWNYVDVVAERMETVGSVHSEGADRPPDSSG